MIVGYLVPHRCGNPALGKCVECGRGFCEEHLTDSPKGRICLADLQGLDQPIALPLTAATFSQADIDTFNRASTFDSDDDRAGDMFADLS
ncbi:MAG: hypothetical protein DWB59_00920 [Anaerolineae bacterium]|nr:hypothetical protein [Anaerolineae bacterium]